MSTVVSYIGKWKLIVGHWLTIMNTKPNTIDKSKMKSEDELFRKLSQRPFGEVRLVVRDMHIRKMPGYKIKAALRNRGWTVEEYSQSHMDALKHECDLAFVIAFGEVNAHLNKITP